MAEGVRVPKEAHESAVSEYKAAVGKFETAQGEYKAAWEQSLARPDDNRLREYVEVLRSAMRKSETIMLEAKSMMFKLEWEMLPEGTRKNAALEDWNRVRGELDTVVRERDLEIGRRRAQQQANIAVRAQEKDADGRRPVQQGQGKCSVLGGNFYLSQLWRLVLFQPTNCSCLDHSAIGDYS